MNTYVSDLHLSFHPSIHLFIPCTQKKARTHVLEGEEKVLFSGVKWHPVLAPLE